MKIDLNPDLTEILGILLGDGNIYINIEKGQYQLDISLNLIDEPRYVMHVKKLMEKVFQKPIKISNQQGKAISLRYYDKLIIQYLMKLGLMPGKKTLNQVKVPDIVFTNNNLIAGCIKGLFDTDGSIAIEDPKDMRLTFSNSSKPLAKDFYQMCLILGIEPSPTIKFSKKKRSWRVIIARKDEVKKFLNIIKPEKIKEPFRRIWIASTLLYLNAPSIVKIQIKKEVEIHLKACNQSQFRFSKDNAKFLNNLCERIIKVNLNSDKVNELIGKVFDLEKFMYSKERAENLKYLYEKLRSTKRIVEYLIFCGDTVVPYRQVITKHISRLFAETKQNYKRWLLENPKFRIGIDRDGNIKNFPTELRNIINLLIFEIIFEYKNEVSNFEIIQKLKLNFVSNDILIMIWLLDNPKYSSSIEKYLTDLVFTCKEIAEYNLKGSSVNITRLSRNHQIPFDRRTLTLMIDFLLKRGIISR